MYRFLRHFFFPHETNNHRAKALHPDTMLVYILLLALFNFGFRYIHREYPSILGYATDIRLSELLNLTNKKRAGLGLSELRLNAKLSEAAAKKAADMFSHNYWSHTSPEGKTPWTFVISSGYQYTMAGENLAKNFSTSSGVVEAWMASPTHRDNIIKPGYRDIGFAIVNGILNGEETTLIVEIFGASDKEEVIAQKPVPLSSGVSTEALGDQTPLIFFGAPSQEASKSFINSLTSVIQKPVINIPTMTRDIVFIFLGLLIGILIIDGYVVSKKRIVRVAGHNFAHIMFFLAISIALLLVKRGVLL
ncbi:CAP domain-containing protein [Patescibacteria group bacterium]|nr:CAP domain-containing protein [Patescibacteria group bacterium]